MLWFREHGIHILYFQQLQVSTRFRIAVVIELISCLFPSLTGEANLNITNPAQTCRHGMLDGFCTVRAKILMESRNLLCSKVYFCIHHNSAPFSLSEQEPFCHCAYCLENDGLHVYRVCLYLRESYGIWIVPNLASIFSWVLVMFATEDKKSWNCRLERIWYISTILNRRGCVKSGKEDEPSPNIP